MGRLPGCVAELRAGQHSAGCAKNSLGEELVYLDRSGSVCCAGCAAQPACMQSASCCVLENVSGPSLLPLQHLCNICEELEQRYFR